MPFKSQAQRRYMYATNPKMARKFSNHTPKGAKLPERVKEAGLKQMAKKLLQKVKENPKAVATVVLPGGTLIPVASAANAAIKRSAPAVRDAMKKSPDFNRAVQGAFLKMGHIKKSVLVSMREELSKIAAPNAPGTQTMSMGMPPMMPLGGLAKMTGRLSASRGLSGAYNLGTRKPNVVKNTVNKINNFVKKRINP